MARSRRMVRLSDEVERSVTTNKETKVGGTPEFGVAETINGTLGGVVLPETMQGDF